MSWLRRNLFGSWLDGGVTLLLGGLLLWLLAGFLRWALIDAVFVDPTGDTCRAAQQSGGGACWAVVLEKGRFILFGTYPYELQWRAGYAVLTIAVTLFAFTRRFLWGAPLALVGAAGALLSVGLMHGFGILAPVPAEMWGGLPLTLLLALGGLVLAFPLAILLALARTGALPVLRWLATFFIELVRGVPLISVLFMAAVMVPLLLPPGVSLDKLLRALLGFALFAAAYLAEVIRGGLQAVPASQREAATALGLGYWQAARLVVLPQALRHVIPPLFNTAIGFFKDTSLVIIIGLFDLLATAKAALADPQWRFAYREIYLLAALVYFLFCFGAARHGRHLDRLLNRRQA